MSEFDAKARDWDKNQLYIERSEVVANAIQGMIPLHKNMKALEYGSGTALLSFALKDQFAEITLMDSSRGMTEVTQEKIAAQHIRKMKPLFFDLEHENYTAKFDIIYNQMVMHHVNDVDTMLTKFFSLLNPGGYIALVDLYSEDGSFHGEGFNGHLGFDVELLSDKLKEAGFRKVEHQQCFTIERKDEDGRINGYPLFLLTACKPK